MNQFEIQILLWIQDNLRGFMNGFWIFVTSLADRGWFWILMAVALLIFKKTRTSGIMVLVALAFNHVLTNEILKEAFGRPRPYMVTEELTTLIPQLSSFSFPSGHTSTSFSAAFVLFKMLPKKFGVPALILAAMIGFSRLYVGVHYPTDVLGGVIVGFLCSVCAYYLLEFVRWKIEESRRNA